MLEVLWSADQPLSATQVQSGLADRGDELALTTVLTVLSRLEAKGSVERTDGGSRSLFGATGSATAMAAESMLSVLGGVDDREDALQRFTGSLSEHDLETLRRVLGS